MPAEPAIHEVWRPVKGSGRLWEIVSRDGDECVLYPLGGDVSPAQSGGQMHGGVRRIRRTVGVVLGRWVRVR